MKIFPILLMTCLLWLMPPVSCRAAAVLFSSPELAVSEELFISGEDLLAAVRLDLGKDWHAYAHGEKRGKPTVLSFVGLPAEKLADIEVFYPPGRPEADISAPGRKALIYEGRTTLFVLFKKGAAVNAVKGAPAALDLLLCSARSCLPLKAVFSLAASGAENAPDAALRPEIVELWRQCAAFPATAGQGAAPFSARSGDISAGAAPLSGAALGGASLALEAGGGPGRSPDQSPGPRLTPRFYDAGLEVGALGKAVFLGLLAGLLLNIMPCVLPVLTLKAGALLVVGAQEDARRRKSMMRRYSLFFALGIMSFFALVAVLAGAAGQMWGQSFQNPEAVHAMAAVVFLLSSSLFGAFTLPVLDLKAGTGFSSAQAYFTGLFTTLLATPCSGPLLGGVLGWTFTQPGPARGVVFASIGLGMALPHFFMAWRPGMAMRLPSPGPWMGVVEKLVGFFLLGVGLYLVSILPSSMHIPVMAGVLLMVVAGWIWGRWGGIYAPTKARRAAVGLLAACIIALGAFLPYAGGSGESPWENFDYAAFRAALGHENMLLNFTADWCPNCKLLDAAVLGPEKLRVWKKRYNLRLIRVDLTTDNAPGRGLLKELKSGSIPLAAIFPAGPGASSPLVLRDIFTAAQLESALEAATGGAKP